MSTATWQDIAPGENAEFSVRYRSSFVFAEWAFPQFGPTLVKALPKKGDVLVGGRVRIINVEYFAPGTAPPEMLRGQKRQCWGLRYTWEKIAAGTPVVVLAAALIAVAVTFALVLKFTEKETHQIADDFRGGLDDIKGTLQETIFNPGLIVAAMVVAVLVLKRR